MMADVVDDVWLVQTPICDQRRKVAVAFKDVLGGVDARRKFKQKIVLSKVKVA